MTTQMGHADVVEYLFNRGANLNVVQYGGRTPLLNAAFSEAEGAEETALFMVSTGAVTNQGPYSIDYIYHYKYTAILQGGH